MLAVVNVAAYLEFSDAKVSVARVALGSVAPTPVRAVTVENALLGNVANEGLFKTASQLVLQDIKPISDVRAGAEYRKRMAVTFTTRALKTALQRAQGGPA